MADLKPCPFCGGTPSTIERPDNIDGTEFFYAVSCYCGGYSACAHKMAKCKTPEQAKADAIAAWNTRTSDGVKTVDERQAGVSSFFGLSPYPEREKTDVEIQTSEIEAAYQRGKRAGYADGFRAWRDRRSIEKGGACASAISGVPGTSEIGKRSTSAATASGHEIPDASAPSGMNGPAGQQTAQDAVANGGDARVASAGCASGVRVDAPSNLRSVPRALFIDLDSYLRHIECFGSDDQKRMADAVRKTVEPHLAGVLGTVEASDGGKTK